MARDAQIEARLQRWAQWVTVGDGSGYAAVNTLHPNWSPPTPGMRPGLRVARGDSDSREMHRAIGRLSVRLANTVVVHYCLRGPLADQAARLGCAVSTVGVRVEEAHRRLRAILAGEAGEVGDKDELQHSRLRVESGTLGGSALG